jgi:hypothetical protein
MSDETTSDVAAAEPAGPAAATDIVAAIPDPAAVGKRRAVVFIPGLKRVERNVRRNELVENLLVNEQVPVRRSGEADSAEINIPGASGIRLRGTGLRANGRAPSFGTLDVFEAYWVDQLPVDAEQKPFVRVTRGLSLLAYWLISPLWSAFSTATWQITAGLLFGGVALVVWYLSILITVAGLWVDKPSVELATAANAVAPGLLAWLKGAATSLATWNVWPLIAFLIPITPVMVVVDHAQAVKTLLTNAVDASGVGRRSWARKAVGDVLSAAAGQDVAAGEPAYDEVIVIAHSFGSILLIDLLADWPHTDDFQRLKVITLGSPQSVLAVRSDWLRAETEKVLAAKPVRSWVDVSSANDYLSAPIDGHAAAYGEEARLTITLESGFLPFSTGAHDAYVAAPEVLRLLVE